MSYCWLPITCHSSLTATQCGKTFHPVSHNRSFSMGTPLAAQNTALPSLPLSWMLILNEPSLIMVRFVMPFSDQGPPPMEKVLSSLQLELTMPYSHLLLPSQAELPSTCLALGVLDSLTRWYIFSDAEELRQARADLKRLIQVSKATQEIAELLP